MSVLLSKDTACAPESTHNTGDLGHPDVVLETTLGRIKIELYWRHAPRTCENFARLADKGYYNGVKFHRVIKDFMVQSGDPTGTGRGGESVYGGKFDDEIHDKLYHSGAGILSMANAGPNTNGSQFFITLAPAPWLDKKHTIFGRIVEGMRVVQRLGSLETDKNDRPKATVKIMRAHSTKGEKEDQHEMYDQLDDSAKFI